MIVTHIAGMPVNYNGRVIQRCALCGYKMIDTKGQERPVGDNRPHAIWQAGDVVETDEESGRASALPAHRCPHNETMIALPESICIFLVED